MPSYVDSCVQDADAELQGRVRKCLAERHMPGLRFIEVEASGGTVVLHGSVRSFYEKQMCYSYCRRVPGVLKLIDEIAVNAD